MTYIQRKSPVNTKLTWSGMLCGDHFAHNDCMARKPTLAPHEKPPHFIRQWRESRHWTQDQLVERLRAFDDPKLPGTSASLSRVENFHQPYTQRLLEALADIFQTDPGSLIMRDPTRSETIWSIWDRASPGEREQISRVAESLITYRPPPAIGE